MSKWTNERVAQLTDLIGSVEQVSQALVSTTAEAMEVTKRSIASKLRKMGFDVEKVSQSIPAYTPENTDEIRAFLDTKSGQHTYAEIADLVCGGEFGAKSMQGKILSMELTAAVKATPAKEVVKSFSDAEQDTVVSMAKAGKFLEEIAECLGKSLNVIRGKVLSLIRAEILTSFPKQKNSKSTVDPLSELNVSEMSVAAIAEALGKSERGIKTMLTNRGLNATDYKAKVKDVEVAAA